MSRVEPSRKKADYYDIKEGSFRVPTDEKNPDAIKREYHNPKTKTDGVAYELSFDNMFGFIQDIRFFENTLNDGTTLRSLHIVMDEDKATGREKIISVPVDGRYAMDFLKRLPNIDLSKEVKLTPYDIDKKGPRRVGISVTQPDDTGVFIVKIPGNFFEQVEELADKTKKYTVLHGFPVATDEDRSDWPFYFKKVSKFLIAYTKENVLPKLSEAEKKNVVADAVLDAALTGSSIDYPKEDINPDDIPF